MASPAAVWGFGFPCLSFPRVCVCPPASGHRWDLIRFPVPARSNLNALPPAIGFKAAFPGDLLPQGRARPSVCGIPSFLFPASSGTAGLRVPGVSRFCLAKSRCFSVFRDTRDVLLNLIVRAHPASHGRCLPALGRRRLFSLLFQISGKSGTGLNTVRAHSTSQSYTHNERSSVCVS